MRTEIVTNMPDPEYRAHEGVSISELKTLASGIPADAVAYREQKKEPSAAMVFGRLVHLAILEPHLFGDGLSHHVKPDGIDGRTKAGKDWLAANCTLPVLPQSGDYSLTTIRDMKRSLVDMPEANAVLGWRGSNEASLFAVDEPTGLQLKGRVDRLSEDDSGRPVIVDLKTTDNVAEWERTASSLRYWMQDAYYTRLARLNDIDPLFVFIVVGTKFPHAVRLGVLDDQARQRGEAENRRLLDLYAQCKSRNEWPSYKVRENMERVGLETFNLKIWT